MKDINNIEELFRESLGSFEADPGAGAWNAIQQGMNTSTGGTGSAVAGASKLSIIKLFAGVAIISTGIGLTAGYFYSEKKHQNKAENKEVVNNKETTDQTVENKNQLTVESKVEEQPALIKESDLQQEHVIVKDEQKKKNIIVSVKETPNYTKYKSSVDSWITPSNGNHVTTNSNSTNVSTTNTTNNTSTAVNVVVVEKDESLPIASIKRSVAGGPAPLTVTFTNSSEEETYEWRNDDFDEVVKTPSLTHTFNEPGIYSVSLTTKNSSGKKSTDVVQIEVGESIKKDEAPKMKVETYGVNVFSPNGDNTNDIFFFDCENIESFFIQVIDREGQVYFESHDPNFRWDGTTTTGEKIKDGTYIYWYHAVGLDKVVIKDTRTLDIKTKR